MNWYFPVILNETDYVTIITYFDAQIITDSIGYRK